MTTEARVRGVLQEEGYKADEPVTAQLIDDLGMDSLDLTEFALGLEEEFLIAVKNDDECEWNTLLDAVQYVDRAQAR